MPKDRRMGNKDLVVVQDKLDMQQRHQRTIKDLLYEILSPDQHDDDEQIALQQNMAVQMSNSQAKHGTNIIQLQNVVSKKTMGNVVKALKLLDKIQDERISILDITPEPLLIEAPKDDITEGEFVPIMSVVETSDDKYKKFVESCEWLLEQGLSLADAQKRIKKEYVKAALRKTKENRTQAAKLLKIQRTYLSRLLSSLNIVCDDNEEIE